MYPKPQNLKTSSVLTENCELVYETAGAGPLLIMIPGAGAQAVSFYPILPHLTPYFTVLLYDRRQQSRSKHVDGNLRPFNPVQQARDVVALIKAAGHKSAHVFGNSAGGIVALQVASSFPEYLEHVVVHEAPMISGLEEADYYVEWLFEAMEAFYRSGLESAMAVFRREFKGFEEGEPERADCSKEDWENTVRWEFVNVMLYGLNLGKVRGNGVSVLIAQGQKSEGAFYAKGTVKQAQELLCPRAIFPGHHSAHESQPEEFSKALLGAFALLQKNKERKQ